MEDEVPGDATARGRMGKGMVWASVRDREGEGWLQQCHQPLGSDSLRDYLHLQVPCPHVLLPARCQWISLLWQRVGGHYGFTVRTSPHHHRTSSPHPRDHPPSPRISFYLAYFQNLPKASIQAKRQQGWGWRPSLLCFRPQSPSGWRGTEGVVGYTGHGWSLTQHCLSLRSELSKGGWTGA